MFQNLVVLIRDWEAHRDFKFGYYDDKSMPNGQTFNLKANLYEVSDNLLGSEAKSSRANINSSFQHLAVFTLPHPLSGREVLD